MGPASLYRQLRMRYANWLIENTDRSVTDIAIEAGFADCAHFSRQFKDAYGLSPSTRRLQPQRVANWRCGARARFRLTRIVARRNGALVPVNERCAADALHNMLLTRAFNRAPGSSDLIGRQLEGRVEIAVFTCTRRRSNCVARCAVVVHIKF